MDQDNFFNTYHLLAGHGPFPWQEALYERFVRHAEGLPTIISIPTGLGKTGIVAIWLAALAVRPDKIPRRLAYVVNRRTVVDQTTNEVVRLRGNLKAAGLFEPLVRLCAIPIENDDSPLALSTLRGQFADNREWSADPARPAVIVGTVDMIGSRLLFGGYGVGFKAKPLHAGFLGQDVLLVHDEAHLEPAFQALVRDIQKEQQQCREFRRFHVMALTATARKEDSEEETSFGLTEAEKNPPAELPDPPTKPLHEVWRRITAPKAITIAPERGGSAETILGVALEERFRDRAILIFARSIEDIEKKIVPGLRKAGQQVQQLTGTLRGLERDRLPTDPIFVRFLAATDRQPDVTPELGTVYLVCTSAGEVGVNISADHMICDLTTFESMAQRFGRVNRFRDREDTEIHIVSSSDFDEEDDYKRRQKKTLALLRQLNGDGSPLALSRLDVKSQAAAFAPVPAILPTSDILFDAWSMTTIRGKLPGRPHVEPYLHGIAKREVPETYVAWREEVSVVTGVLLERYKPEDLIEDYPLKPHELLRDRSDRVFKHLTEIAKRHGGNPIPGWLLDDQGSIQAVTLQELIEKGKIDRIYYCTILLSPGAGGLENGSLKGESEIASDVGDKWIDQEGNQRRERRWSDDPKPERIAGMRLILEIDTQPDEEEDEIRADSDQPAGNESTVRKGRYWRWYVRPRSADDDASKTAMDPVRLSPHTNQVGDYAKKIAALTVPENMQIAIELSGRFHDLGKRRELWQRSIGNPNPVEWYAKSGRSWKPSGTSTYRHEFGSLLDVQEEPDFQRLSEELKDLVLHLIAAHHGRARPHFPQDEVFDPNRKYSRAAVEDLANGVPRRFARMQRKYGRWGLAYLESLLRAADWAASNKPSASTAGEL